MSDLIVAILLLCAVAVIDVCIAIGVESRGRRR